MKKSAVMNSFFEISNLFPTGDEQIFKKITVKHDVTFKPKMLANHISIEY